jgi:hypothetical protein
MILRISHPVMLNLTTLMSYPDYVRAVPLPLMYINHLCACRTTPTTKDFVLTGNYFARNNVYVFIFSLSICLSVFI